MAQHISSILGNGNSLFNTSCGSRKNSKHGSKYMTLSEFEAAKQSAFTCKTCIKALDKELAKRLAPLEKAAYELGMRHQRNGGGFNLADANDFILLYGCTMLITAERLVEIHRNGMADQQELDGTSAEQLKAAANHIQEFKFDLVKNAQAVITELFTFAEIQKAHSSEDFGEIIEVLKSHGFAKQIRSAMFLIARDAVQNIIMDQVRKDEALLRASEEPVRGKMKRVQQYKGFAIAFDGVDYYSFLKDEWAMGDGFRSAEMEHGSIAEAQMFIDCYGSEDEPLKKAPRASAGSRAAKLKKDEEYHVGTGEIGSILRGIKSLREAKAAAAQWAKYLPCTDFAFVAKFAAGTDNIISDFDAVITGAQMVERKEVKRVAADTWHIRTMRSFDGMDWQPAHCTSGSDGWHIYSESTLRDLGRWQAAGVLDQWLSMPVEAPAEPTEAQVKAAARKLAGELGCTIEDGGWRVELMAPAGMIFRSGSHILNRLTYSDAGTVRAWQALMDEMRDLEPCSAAHASSCDVCNDLEPAEAPLAPVVDCEHCGSQKLKDRICGICEDGAVAAQAAPKAQWIRVYNPDAIDEAPELLVQPFEDAQDVIFEEYGKYLEFDWIRNEVAA